MISIRCSWVGMLAILCVGCTTYAGRDLQIGIANEAEVAAQMGESAMRWQDADGSVQLAYPRGPEGPHTFMVFLAPDGRMRSIENVLTERHFSRIAAGDSMDQVVRLIGPPQPQWTAFFEARNELVWEWRYCDGGSLMAKFDVLFDATTRQVRTSFSRPDYRGPEGVVPTCGQVYGR